ncbi:S-layer homology domain-containing protein [Paenibacillus tarimensis]
MNIVVEMKGENGMQHKPTKWSLICSIIIALATFLPGIGTAALRADTIEPLQLIPDQDYAAAGGTLTFHILYHNSENIVQTQSHISVKVPQMLEVTDPGEAAWNEEERLLTWSLGEMSAGGSAAVRFQLKADAAAETGTAIQLSAELNGSITGKWTTPEVTVTVGTETHQPFMQGYPDGTFRPEGKLTRAEAAAMIARIKGLKEVDGPATYKDVDPEYWAYAYIEQVTEEGYMIGYDGRFRPKDPITKAEMVTIMLRLQKITPVPFETTYGDLFSHWSADVLGTAETLGRIAPGEGAAFSPDQPIERQLAAQWMSAGLLRGPLGDGDIKVEQHFPDVPATHPYFGWIEEVSAVAHESEDRGIGAEWLIRYLPEETNAF